jgi:hypothetical protein
LNRNIPFCIVLKCQKLILLFLLLDINISNPICNSFINTFNMLWISFYHFNVWNGLFEKLRWFFEWIVELLKFIQLVTQLCRSPLVYFHEVLLKSVEGLGIVVLSIECFLLILSQYFVKLTWKILKLIF